uniref:HEAT repeat-containing protein 1 n=1 Tax=Gongylonema pulchrum TaxID=637853 RepID=A0A183EX72_9BILA
LASSIHEIAAIIGEENADTYLVPIFENFAKDAGNVKLGLLNHLYDFFKLVTPKSRRSLLPLVPSFLHSDTENDRNWRHRFECVRQCILLCDLYEMNDVNQYLAAIALTLANGTFLLN